MNGAESETSVQEGSHVVSSITTAYLGGQQQCQRRSTVDQLRLPVVQLGADLWLRQSRTSRCRNLRWAVHGSQQAQVALAGGARSLQQALDAADGAQVEDWVFRPLKPLQVEELAKPEGTGAGTCWVLAALNLGAGTGEGASWTPAIATRGTGMGAGVDQVSAALGAGTGAGDSWILAAPMTELD